MVRDIRHPSLHAKKYDESSGIWQARVNGGWRFYFTIEGDVYHLIDILPHPK
jgi:plasmid maintenance system killer protein